MSDDKLSKQRYKFTELGNAERLAAEHGHSLRYVAELEAWLEWDGRRWQRCDQGAAVKAAKRVARALYTEAAGLARAAADDTEGAAAHAKEVLRWATRSQTSHAIHAVATLAQTEDPIASSPDAFDTHPNLLSVRNGTIDLLTGDLLKHRREDMITQLAPFDFDPNAKCPRWDKFMKSTFPSEETRGWMQRFIGYCLTGDVGEQILAYCIGTGANGKSTLWVTIQGVLGSYAVQAEPSLLLAKKHGDELARRQRAVLRGKRLALCQEPEQGRPLDESQVKQLTGGDIVTAAEVYEKGGSFKPTHKLVVSANHLPPVHGADDGIWRRFRFVPFTQTVSKGKRDPDLPEKLLEEASGILAWAVRGCLEWRKRGLGDCPEIDGASSEYRAEEDTLGEFLDKHTVIDPGGFVPTACLVKLHEDWCKVSGERPLNSKTMPGEMRARGLRVDRCDRSRGFGQVRGVFGLRLVETAETDLSLGSQKSPKEEE